MRMKITIAAVLATAGFASTAPAPAGAAAIDPWSVSHCMVLDCYGMGICGSDSGDPTCDDQYPLKPYQDDYEAIRDAILP
jgi:hypothetical protein